MGPSISTLSKFPGDADDAGLGATLSEPLGVPVAAPGLWLFHSAF